jgi:hypothetical protein
LNARPERSYAERGDRVYRNPLTDISPSKQRQGQGSSVNGPIRR